MSLTPLSPLFSILNPQFSILNPHMLLIKRFRWLPVLVLCFPLLFVGCSDQVQVKGKVTLPDGTPIGVGDVVFEKGDFAATGVIKRDGSYTMGSFKATDGLPKGEYTVYIRGATQTGEAVEFRTLGGGGQMQTMSIPSLEPIIAKAYTSASTSPLKVNVQASMTYDIEVPPAE